MRSKLFAVLVSIAIARTISAVPVIPNVALIKGIVLESKEISSTLLDIQPEQTMYKLTIQIESSEDVGEMPNFLKGEQGKDIDFYTKKPLPLDILRKRIRAKVSYRGDERGGRWWVDKIEILD